MDAPQAIALYILLFWFVVRSLLVVPDGAVVLIYWFGRAGRGYGPGIHVVWSFGRGMQRLRLKVGMVLKLTSEKSIEFKGCQVPVVLEGEASLGQPDRILRFEGTTPVVTAEGVPNEHQISCEKCGHKMQVRI